MRKRIVNYPNGRVYSPESKEDDRASEQKPFKHHNYKTLYQGIGINP